MEKITVGIIGTGNILSSHLAGLEANPEFELVCICGLPAQMVQQQADQLGCKGFTDYHDLLAERPDVALVSLPHGLHCQVTVDALQAGCHVLVEKPMAVSVEECRRMLETAEACDRHLIVTDSASFYPGAMRTGEKFKAGRLGRFFTGCVMNERLYFHENRPAWFLDPAASGGGMFSNVGLHRLALARACLPGLTPVLVSGSVSHVPQHAVEGCTSAIVKYAQGGSMLYEEVGYYPRPKWLRIGIHFVFEEGIVGWDGGTWRIMTRQGKEIEEPLDAQPVPYAPIYANMLRAIRGEDYTPKAWELAVDTAVVHAAYASSRQAREIDLRSPQWIITKPKR